MPVSTSTDNDLEFPDLPPFPSNVPTVPLLRINLRDLLSGSASEEDKLWHACRDVGFFYFDLRASEKGEELLESADVLFKLANDIFSLPTEEKIKYDFVTRQSYFGYKALGGGIIDAKGTGDRSEFWNVSKDDILGFGERLENPEVLTREENREKIKTYMLQSHELVLVVLEKLNKRLGLPDGTLANLHRLEKASGDQVRWVRSPPRKMDEKEVALGAHTDFGSVTILFNRLGGLQVLPPNQEEWAYVKPLRGHCVVNLGDAMVKFSAGILNSNIHRVVSPPGEQETSTRHSLVYFNRPEDDIILKSLEGSAMIDARKQEGGDWDDGEDINAKDWILRRALNRRTGGDFNKGTGTEWKGHSGYV